MPSPPTSSFWLCPTCNRHVPSRQASCQCGFNRVSEKSAVSIVTPPRAAIVAQATVVADDSHGFNWFKVFKVGAGAASLAAAIYVSRDSGTRPTPASIDKSAEARAEALKLPQVIYVPVPSDYPRGAAQARATTPDAPDEAANEPIDRTPLESPLLHQPAPRVETLVASPPASAGSAVSTLHARWPS
jgi:hypothetical protein